MYTVIRKRQVYHKFISLVTASFFFLSIFTSDVLALSPELRSKPFSDATKIEFQQVYEMMCIAGTLKALIQKDAARPGNIMRLNNELKARFPNGEVEIEAELREGALTTGRQYKYAVFRFKKENKTVEARFFDDDVVLTADERRELGVRTDEDGRHFFDSPEYPALRGVWFVNSDAKATSNAAPAAPLATQATDSGRATAAASAKNRTVPISLNNAIEEKPVEPVGIEASDYGPALGATLWKRRLVIEVIVGSLVAALVLAVLGHFPPGPESEMSYANFIAVSAIISALSAGIAGIYTHVALLRFHCRYPLLRTDAVKRVEHPEDGSTLPVVSKPPSAQPSERNQVAVSETHDGILSIVEDGERIITFDYDPDNETNPMFDAPTSLNETNWVVYAKRKGCRVWWVKPSWSKDSYTLKEEDFERVASDVGDLPEIEDGVVLSFCLDYFANRPMPQGMTDNHMSFAGTESPFSPKRQERIPPSNSAITDEIRHIFSVLRSKNIHIKKVHLAVSPEYAYEEYKDIVLDALNASLVEHPHQEDSRDGSRANPRPVPAVKPKPVAQGAERRTQESSEDAFARSADAARKEAYIIHDENLRLTPSIPDKTIICHVVTDSILPVQQRGMLKTLEQEMRDEKYGEKVVSLQVADSAKPEEFMAKLEALKAQIESQYQGYKVQFDVACPAQELVEKIQNLGMQALAFAKEGDGDIVQVEGIVLALRALRTGSIANLLSAFKTITGRDYAAGSADINELARMLLFILPVRKIDVNAIGTINRLIEENVKKAA